MRSNKPNIASLIDGLFPDHVAASYPKLIEFAKEFFKYLEEKNKSSFYQNTLHTQRDIRIQEEQFLELIQKELGINISRKFAADPKVFYDYITLIWQSKGSEESIKAFFRLFLNDKVEIYYPWESVLIPSDGRWIVESVIRVTEIQGNAEDFALRTIKQIGSDAEAIVDRVERRVYSDGIIYEFYLIPLGTSLDRFSPGGVLFVEGTDLRAEVYRSVSHLKIINGGFGYEVGEKITLTGYEGFTFTAYVDGVDDFGSILNINITNFGSGNTPLHVRQLNTTELYYLIDYLIYQYSNDEQVGRSEVVINIDTKNGSGAELKIAYDSISTYKGRYDGVKGQLSESIVLQDSKYYQKFSYEVATAYSTSEWLQPLKKLAHPAGMEVIGNVKVFQYFNVGIKDVIIFTKEAEVVQYTIIESPGLESRVLGFSQDYVIPNDVYFAEDYVGIAHFSDTDIIPELPTIILLDTNSDSDVDGTFDSNTTTFDNASSTFDQG